MRALLPALCLATSFSATTALGTARVSTRNVRSSSPKSKSGVDQKLKRLTSLDQMIAGGIATAVGDLSLHPIDTIKTIQQAAPGGLSLLGAGRKIVRETGLLGLYSGVVPYVTMDGLSGAIKFATYEGCKKFVEPLIPTAMHAYSRFACAAVGMLTCSVVLVPGELLKQRMQAGIVPGLFSGIKQIWRESGPPGFFVGIRAILIRDVPYTMLELGLYENFKSAIKRWRQRVELTSTEEFSAAALTGAIVGFATNPLDLVKTRLMTSTTYNGFWDVVSNMYKTEGGLRAFLSGSSARVMWLLPFTVIQLTVWEMTKRALADLKPADITDNS